MKISGDERSYLVQARCVHFAHCTHVYIGQTLPEENKQTTDTSLLLLLHTHAHSTLAHMRSYTNTAAHIKKVRVHAHLQYQANTQRSNAVPAQK
mmetsp:Transcript_40325/g.104598  ORF Transcript_40325/g.104598 Transcript_40325/m.104598 type:complete len:94 (+) Transcript_40325:4526-4807(+)